MVVAPSLASGRFRGYHDIDLSGQGLAKEAALFRLSRECDYAMRALLELGRIGRQTWMPTTQVARGAGVPLPFLHKIVGKLARAGLVQTRAGPKGGLRLGMDLKAITLLCVFEAVEGPIVLSDCLVIPGTCRRAWTCSGRFALAELQEGMRHEMARITLARLLKSDVAAARRTPSSAASGRR